MAYHRNKKGYGAHAQEEVDLVGTLSETRISLKNRFVDKGIFPSRLHLEGVWSFLQRLLVPKMQLSFNKAELRLFFFFKKTILFPFLVCGERKVCKTLSMLQHCPPRVPLCIQIRAPAPVHISNTEMQLCLCTHCVCVHFYELPECSSEVNAHTAKSVSAWRTSLSACQNEPLVV